MSTAGYPRWAISLADLTLLLLGFSVLLYASTGGAGREGTKAHAASERRGILFQEAAAPLFAGGEARLTTHARVRLNDVGRRVAPGKARIQIVSSGSAPGSGRFDRWELTAARTAAVARAITEAGIAQDRVDLVIPPLPKGAAEAGQRIVVRLS